MKSLHSLLPAFGLVAVVTGAVADVDLFVGSAARIKGTLLPEGEVEVVRFRGQRFGTLDFSVTAGKSAALDLSVRLIDPRGNELEIQGESGFKDAARRVVGRRLPLAESGDYRLEISGTGTGAYVLKLRSRARARRTLSQDVDTGASFSLQTSVPSGARFEVAASAAKGSAAVPRVVSVGPVDTSGIGRLGSASHTLRLTEGVPEGLVDVTVRNDGAAGAIVLSVAVKMPRVRPVRLDVRAFRVGSPRGSETALATLVGPQGGLLAIADPMSSIAGAGVDIEPGALVEATPILISTTAAAMAPNKLTTIGPWVRVLIETPFAVVPWTVRVPYEPRRVPLNRDPSTDVRVLIVSPDGATSVSEPIEVDLEGHTVAVSTREQGAFVAVARSGAPNASGWTYWTLRSELRFAAGDPKSGDSRRRDILVHTGTAAFGEHNAPGTIYSTSTRGLTMTHDDEGVARVELVPETCATRMATWRYGIRDVFLRFVVEFRDDVRVLNAADTGAVIVSEVPSPFGERTEAFEVLLRRSGRPATPSSVSGSYFLCGTRLVAVAKGGPADVEIHRFYGVLDLDPDGGCSAIVRDRFGSFSGERGTEVHRFQTSRWEGTFRIRTEPDRGLAGALELAFQSDDSAETPPAVMLMPGADGEILMGCTEASESSGLGWMYAVRLNRHPPLEGLTGAYVSAGFGIQSRSYCVGSPCVHVGDFGVGARSGYHGLDASSQMSLGHWWEEWSGRDKSVDPDGVGTDGWDSYVGSSAPFHLADDGTFTSNWSDGYFDFPVRGVVSPSTGTLLAVDRDRFWNPLGITFLLRQANPFDFE